MPSRKSNKRNHKKRVTKVPMRVTQPNTMKIKLRYALNGGDVREQQSETGDVVDHQYRANGMFDPYAGTGGGDPRGFAEYMALYKNFTVIKSKITVRWMYPDGAVDSHPCRVGIILSRATDPFTGKSDVTESSRALINYINAQQGSKTVTKTYTPAFLGYKSPMDEANLKGTITVDPATFARFHVVSFCLNNESQTTMFTGFIDYTAILTGPVLPPQ